MLLPDGGLRDMGGACAPQPLRTAPDNMRRNNKLHGTIALFSVVFRFIYVKRCPMRRRVKSL